MAASAVSVSGNAVYFTPYGDQKRPMSGLTASRHSPEWPQPPPPLAPAAVSLRKRLQISSSIAGCGGRTGAQAARSDIGMSRWKFRLKSEDASPRSGS